MAEDNNKDLARTAALSAWAFFTLVLLFSIIFLMREMIRQGQDPLASFDRSAAESAMNTVNAELAEQMRDITLYFGAPQAFQMNEELRRIQFSSTSANCRAALEALIEGPHDSGFPVLPMDTQIRGVYFRTDGELVVDLSRELESKSSPGVASEMLMLQSLLKTLFQPSLRGNGDPPLTSVRFLMEGAPLSGQFPSHVDMSDSFTSEIRIDTGSGFPNV